MSFSISGTTITQTGTDADLSGLAGIAGVTTETHGSGDAIFTTYFVGDRKLSIAGALSHNNTKELLVFGTNTPSITFDITSGGTYNLGNDTTVNGYTYQPTGTGLILPNATLPACCDGQGFMVRSGGTFNWKGATIQLAACMQWATGSTVTINNAVLEATRGSLFRIRSQCTALNIDGFEMYGSASIDFFEIPVTFSGFKPQASDRACEAIDGPAGGTNLPFVFRDYDSAGMVLDFSLWSGPDLQMINLKLNNDPILLFNHHGIGLCQIFKEFIFNVFDTDNIGVQDAKIYFTDTDNGSRYNRKPRSGVDYDLETSKIYSKTSDISGAFPVETVLTRVSYATGNAIPIWDYRSEEGNTNDKFTIKVAHYNKTLSQSSQNLKGEGVLDVSWVLVDDLLVTEEVKATVDAYTSISNAQQFYDVAKSSLIDNYSGEDVSIVGRSGNLIDAHVHDIEVNGTISGNAFELVGNKVTIKSTSYAGGFKTTGTLSQINGAVLNGLELSGGITWNVGQSTWVGSATSTDTVNVAGSGTYTATGFIFDASTTLNNSSGVTINVIISSGQQQPTTSGSVVNFLTAGAVLNFTNLMDANVQILDENSNVVQREVSQTGALVYTAPSGSSGNWCYIVNRAGYEPIRGSFLADGSDLSIDGTQTQKKLADGSVAYLGTTSSALTVMPLADGSRMNLRIGDSLVSAQAIFDETENALQTQDGMNYLCNGGGEVSFQLLATGIFIFLGSNVRVIRDNSLDVNATISAFVQSTDGIILDGTNGSVQFVTPSSDVNIVSVNDVAVASVDDFKATTTAVDLSALETKAQADARQALLIGEHNQTQTDITNIPTSTAPTVLEIRAGFDEEEFKADVSAIDLTTLETKAQADARQVALITEHDSTQASISSLNDFDHTSDVVSRVTLVDTTTANTDMRGTDLANTVTPPTTAEIESALLNEGDGQQLIDAIVQSIGNTNLSEVSVVAAVRADLERAGGKLDTIETDTNELQQNQSGAGLTAAQVYAEFTSGNNEDVFKADVSGVTFDDTPILNAIAALNDITASEVYSEFTNGSNEDVFKADVSGITFDSAPILNAIAALNDLSVSDVEGSDLAKQATLTDIVNSIANIPTTDSVADLAPVLTAITNLNDITAVEVRGAFDEAEFKDKNTELEIHNWLDSYSNKDSFKSSAAGVHAIKLQGVITSKFLTSHNMENKNG